MGYTVPMYDTIIIGGGPAGLAAAVYFARQQLRFALFTGHIGGQVAESSDIENYLGLHELTGVNMVKKFVEHIGDYKKHFDLHEDEKVMKVDRINGGFTVATDKGTFQTKTLLIATGSEHRKLHVPGEEDFQRKGVTYCATCDAPLFRDKRIAIIGGGNSAMDAALFSEKYSEHIDLIVLNPELRGDDVMKDKVSKSSKITVHYETKTIRIEGKTTVDAIVVQGKEGNEERISVQGVFVEIGLEPVTGFIDFVGKDKWGQLIVDKVNQTNVEGVWAAGDVTDITEKQIAVAVGEGSKAALSIIKYLQTRNA